MTKIQNSNLDEILKSLNSRHSGEACAGLDPVAGVQKLLKLLDSAKASLRARLSAPLRPE